MCSAVQCCALRGPGWHNGSGVLNHKYAGETAVRGSSVPYAVVRSVGLTTDDEDTPFLLDIQQVTGAAAHFGPHASKGGG